MQRSPTMKMALRGAFGLCISGVAATALAACAPQSEECQQYLECQVHYEEELSLPETQVNRFKADGVCWESQELADDCTTTCRRRMAQYIVDLQEAEKEPGPCVNTFAADAGTNAPEADAGE